MGRCCLERSTDLHSLDNLIQILRDKDKHIKRLERTLTRAYLLGWASSQNSGSCSSPVKNSIGPIVSQFEVCSPLANSDLDPQAPTVAQTTHLNSTSYQMGQDLFLSTKTVNHEVLEQGEISERNLGTVDLRPGKDVK